MEPNAVFAWVIVPAGTLATGFAGRAVCRGASLEFLDVIDRTGCGSGCRQYDCRDNTGSRLSHTHFASCDSVQRVSGYAAALATKSSVFGRTPRLVSLLANHIQKFVRAFAVGINSEAL